MDSEQKFIYATRDSRNDTNGPTKVDISAFQYFLIDCQSGGSNRNFSGSALFGYLPYSEWCDKFACSGQHDFGENSLKVMIPKGYNSEEPYKSVYKELLRNASYSSRLLAKEKQKRQRPKLPPCTREILSTLENNNNVLERKDLREILTGKGYETKTICNALHSLHKQGKITMEKDCKSDGRNPHQKIALL